MVKIPGMQDFGNLALKPGPDRGMASHAMDGLSGGSGMWSRDIGPVLAEHLLETMFGRVEDKVGRG